MKILFDTNTFISSAISQGKPRKLLFRALAGEFILISSKELLKELKDVIDRPKFQFSPFERKKFINTVRKTVTLVEIVSDFKVVLDDPDDDMVLNTAYDGKADYIVTGDPDLLRFKEFKGVKIVTADEMLKILEGR